MKKKGAANSRPNPRPNPNPNPNPQQLVHAQTYGTINEAVHEYLLKSGLFRTVDTFQVYFSFNN